MPLKSVEIKKAAVSVKRSAVLRKFFLPSPTCGLNSVKGNLHVFARNAILGLINVLAFLFYKMPITNPPKLEMSLTGKRRSMTIRYISSEC